MKRNELAAIKERSVMPQSLGYTFTHYANDVQALLVEIDRLKAQIPDWNDIDEEMEADAQRLNDLCEESAEFERRALKAEAQALKYREALEKGPSDHDAFCTNMNHHPSPEIKDCKCWQKVKMEALTSKKPITKLNEFDCGGELSLCNAGEKVECHGKKGHEGWHFYKAKWAESDGLKVDFKWERGE